MAIQKCFSSALKNSLPLDSNRTLIWHCLLFTLYVYIFQNWPYLLTKLCFLLSCFCKIWIMKCFTLFWLVTFVWSTFFLCAKVCSWWKQCFVKKIKIMLLNYLSDVNASIIHSDKMERHLIKPSRKIVQRDRCKQWWRRIFVTILLVSGDALKVFLVTN